jgi:hypothetical protein
VWRFAESIENMRSNATYSGNSDFHRALQVFEVGLWELSQYKAFPTVKESAKGGDKSEPGIDLFKLRKFRPGSDIPLPHTPTLPMKLQLPSHHFLIAQRVWCRFWLWHGDAQ